MSADGAGGGEMQFDKVDLVAPAEARSCRICKLPIAAEYFQIGQAIICSRCATTLSGSQEGRGMFLRALLFGAGAALLGTIAWFAIIKATGHEFGLLAIGVGLFVGVAVKRGGRGLGGWRYQALAMILTYVSITGAYVPLVLKGIAEASAESATMVKPSLAAKDDAAATAAQAAAEKAPEEKSGAGSMLLAVGLILGLAFAAPFMGGASNIMGIIILGIGLYEAWKINRRIPLSGPFRFGPAGKPIIATPAGAPPPALMP
ncbi:MAG TPA: hypothetical protein VGP07_05595 [Polyangia bacterium]|jgi:hypothetical protein